MNSYSQMFETLDETQKRGQATEAILKAEFLVRDIPVLVPEYDNEPYDFVIDVGRTFYRIQAKTAYENTEGTVCFETVSTRARSDGYERDDYEDEIEYFAVYNPLLDESYLIPIDDAAQGKMEIRHQAPKNNQRQGINWHQDYLLDKRIRELQ